MDDFDERARRDFRRDYSMHSWCAHFAEVRVDEDFGTVRVSHLVSAFDCGRLYNPKLVESQWRGGDHHGHRSGVVGRGPRRQS